MSNVTDNTASGRFELAESGQTAFATYRHDGNSYALRHVEAPVELRGKGTAGRLMEGIVSNARAGNFKIVPLCPYAVAWFKRHPDAADVLA
ncbi:MAG TPA: GNAT family N-acetyltransferase [Rhizomicrobium sp.]|jgi:hypothetical protein|nr:GNAT family N-acetyltransferase [Rhizomicrobium sp.]